MCAVCKTKTGSQCGVGRLLSQTIGVLALQGDFAEHIEVFRSLGVTARAVRLPEDLEGLDGLVIPGGESTTIARLAELYQLPNPIREGLARGMALWGTCAGMIVIAQALADPYPTPFGFLDIKVARNWFGRQTQSFEIDLDIQGLGNEPFRGVFIRAPAVVSVGPGVEVLARLADGTPVVVCSGQILGTAFHPELTDDTRMHQMFLRLASPPHGNGIA